MEVFEEKLSEIIVRAKNLNQNVETPQMGVINITSSFDYLTKNYKGNSFFLYN